MTFEDGSEAGPANGVYIHHVISFDISKPANLPVSKCGAGQAAPTRRISLGSEFLAQGDDSGSTGSILFTSKDGTYQSGFLVGANDKILQQVDLVNYNAESKKVLIKYEIEYVDGHVGSDAAAALMSVTGCNNQGQASEGHSSHGAPTPPKSSINLNNTGIAITESPQFPITADGKIVMASKLFQQL